MEAICRVLRVSTLLLVAALAGCATNPDEPNDPFEGFNRGMYSFNRNVDRALIKPAAQVYRAITPDPIETAVGNFFANIGDVVSTLNSLLQLKVTNAAEDGARVAVNTTIGIGGLIDIASGFGIERHQEDFGQTLGYWGVGSGPYVVLPLLGPSSLRDAPGRAVDAFFFDPVFAVNDVALRNGLVAGRAIDARAGLMRAEKVLEQAALDEYSFVRDAYLQRRRHLISDGAD